jgi:carboxyl-terminal processing protease
MFVGGLGVFLDSNVRAQGIPGPSMNLLRKFQTVISLVRLYYVEDVKWDDVIEGAISGMLEKLDPHSVYIPPKEMKQTTENFSGHYEGIGIQFDVVDDAVLVVTPIAGSPAEKVGLMAGDKIIEIDGEPTIGITRDDVPKKLKGPKGTKVKVKVLREGLDEPFEVVIVRDVIPINTVSTAFMIDNKTAYIFVNRFAATTSSEVEKALRRFEKQGMERLILDLRGNPGGYLAEAVKLAGKFLPDKKLVVYTKSRGDVVQEEYFADFQRIHPYRKVPLIILVDRGSASASEIVAGAIQDHDRGIILGTRTFGKGLVQRQFELGDGSAVRITIAKYYTPSGRCIQRPYKGLNSKEYYFRNMTDTTSIKIDSSQTFYTDLGRKVFGGGGIIPDVIVPYKSFSKSPKLNQKIMAKRLYFEFANQLVHREGLSYKNTLDLYRNFTMSDLYWEDFQKLLVKEKINYKNDEFNKDKVYMQKMIKAEIARVLFGSEAYYELLMRYDNQVKAALKHFPEAIKFALNYK